MCQIDWSLVIQSVIAIGTIAVAVLAIWGDWFRQKFASPKLRIELHNVIGQLGTAGTLNKSSWFYHLRVVNDRKSFTSKNTKVNLNAIYKQLPNGTFKSFPLIVPTSFYWAPADLNPSLVTINKSHIFDFIRLIEGDDSAQPCLIRYFKNFEGFVFKDEIVLFELQIISDQFQQEKSQIFEVLWNGIWSETPKNDNLKIREIDKKFIKVHSY